MNATNLIESFSEFKEFKNIDRETMMNILEDVFRSIMIKQYGTDENVDVIIFDLGLSSIQLDDLDRGFSFKSEGSDITKNCSFSLIL